MKARVMVSNSRRSLVWPAARVWVSGQETAGIATAQLHVVSGEEKVGGPALPGMSLTMDPTEALDLAAELVKGATFYQPQQELSPAVRALRYLRMHLEDRCVCLTPDECQRARLRFVQEAETAAAATK